MNNKLIIQLIKNNIEEIQNLINHFQHDENDLKDGFPLLESRLSSLYNDVEILKLNLNNQTNSSSNPITKENVSEEDPKPILNEKDLINEESNNEICDKDDRANSLLQDHEETEDPIPIKETPETNVSTLNDRLQAERGSNLQEKIQKARLIDIQTAIGINDQFLFIRELFDNQPEDYKSAIQYINAQADYDTIINHFDQTMEWNKEEEPVIQFFDLIKRKFE